MKTFENGKNVIELIKQLRGWKKISNCGWFFIWSTKFVEEKNFRQFMISLLNETENPLC